ncbi:MAG: sigma-54-dependent Fis family transcriptional regulator [Deltaproteobacteria bacterium]|jgi:formate hydrogenlyase transcriptional activator|nr:sigma-54-dependent Fis family transcriptional regulator [Deltaproteobacteria bacterium]MBT4644156.1 sigma-54-dependent Fis family transcriptional regulator [Deltaproteobacteria bacterium]MBT6502557.1 sigma-54-dependent Fis family transcriptional regulator [Deltaproteobacteria bacterium]MBT7155367.1 sigma-54-dependent Fis family transcriptional regulator [Deltaproteobacteria bacterium]MBT7715807.1 sigma-54-dependent Fis family transcriptional regulator [Deltaproteobacteria bacterium]
MINQDERDRGQGADILIVDDIAENLEVLAKILTHEGYKVRPTSSGEFALSAIKNSLPDLILLDIKMPGMDGYTVCKKLKASERTEEIPVIFISALSDVNDIIHGFKVGAVDYISKPFQYEEVLARVKTHVMLNKMKKSLEQKNRNLEQENSLRRIAEESLKTAYDEIEKKVDERTRELKIEVTERKKAEKELQQALKELEEIKNQLLEENIYLQEEIKLSNDFCEIIGKSHSLKNVLSQLEQVSPLDSTVLLLGETGTGKELFARAVHNLSPRKLHPLIKVNCAALPANLIENELFGHEKEAFSGAHSKKVGRFELANHGTIFLDEVGDIPMELQAKLLRVLQEGEFERLGGAATIKTDVRVLAATNKDLRKMCAEGEFREDLFYRLYVFPIDCPPLRERKEDIPLLVNHFVARYNLKTAKKIDEIPKKVMNELQAYYWPGNVRELENIIERAIIMSQGKQLQLGNWLTRSSLPVQKEEVLSLDEQQKEHILRVLELTNWRIRGSGGAADILKIHPNTLDARMRKLEINRH